MSKELAAVNFLLIDLSITVNTETANKQEKRIQTGENPHQMKSSWCLHVHKNRDSGQENTAAK